MRRLRDGRGWAGCRGEGDERCGICTGNGGLGRANFRCGFRASRLRTGRDARGSAGVQFQLWPRGSVWQHCRCDIPEFLVESWKVGSQRGGELNFAKLARAQLGQRFLADLQARTHGAGQLLELHDIGKVWKNLRRLRRSGGIDQRLARMRRMYGIGEDALARMKGVGALGRESLRGFAARGRFGFGALHLHQRKIIDRAGPCELRVLERGIVERRGRKLRERHHDKDEVPQGGGNQGTAGNPPLDPAISKKSSTQKTFGDI